MTIELLAIGYALLKQLRAEPGKLTSYWRTDKRKCIWILQRLCHKKHWTSLRWWSMMMNGNYIHKSLAAVHISIVLCLSNQEGNPAKLLYTSVKAFVCPNILLSKVFSWFHECGDGEASNGQNWFPHSCTFQPTIFEFCLKPCSLPSSSCLIPGLLELYLRSRRPWDR